MKKLLKNNELKIPKNINDIKYKIYNIIKKIICHFNKYKNKNLSIIDILNIKI